MSTYRGDIRVHFDDGSHHDFRQADEPFTYVENAEGKFAAFDDGTSFFLGSPAVTTMRAAPAALPVTPKEK